MGSGSSKDKAVKVTTATTAVAATTLTSTPAPATTTQMTMVTTTTMEIKDPQSRASPPSPLQDLTLGTKSTMALLDSSKDHRPKAEFRATSRTVLDKLQEEKSMVEKSSDNNESLKSVTSIAEGQQKQDGGGDSSVNGDILSPSSPPLSSQLLQQNQAFAQNSPIKEEERQPTQAGTAGEGMAEDKSCLPLEPEDQRKFDTILRATNALVKSEAFLGAANKNVRRLALRRALSEHISLGSLVTKLENMQVLDVSMHCLGPQGVRALCLALPPTCGLVSLSIADNKTDTDTAGSIGQLLSGGPPLEYLDVSGNNLGKDYFSRCAGQALKTNTTLQTLRAQSVGMVDVRALLEGVQGNSSLVELDLSNNSITDRQALGAALAAVLKKENCVLQSLALAGCNMDPQGITLLSQGLAANKSLQALNVANNEPGSLQTLAEFLVVAFCHPALRNLHVNDARITDTDVKALTKPASDVLSPLQVLSLNSSCVTNDLFTQLVAIFKGKLLNLLDVDISNNERVTGSAVETLWHLTADAKGKSGICKLTVALNDMNSLPGQASKDRFPKLSYLNFRKARLSAEAMSAFAGLLCNNGPPLTTVVLDGMKLSGKKELADFFSNCKMSQVTAVSLSGCSLNDSDLTPLFDALQSGFRLHMLKLSDNRLTNPSLKALSDSLQKSSTHPLGVLDVSGNQITDAGVKDLCCIYHSKSHTSSLHSLNLANNAIGKEGVLSALSAMESKLPLKCLYINNQSSSFLESDYEDILSKVASVLGYTVKKKGEMIEKGCSPLPALPEGLTINIRGLGGHTGELGPYLDCPAIMTDSSSKRLNCLTLNNILELCASLQGQIDGKCVVTGEDWSHITGADKDSSTPSWLQLPESRTKGVYISNLPGNATSQKLEGLLETEADCNLVEVVLTKDPVTKYNSGTGWVLFADEASVDRALALYHNGDAQMFGSPFAISRISVSVETSTTTESVEKIRQDVAARRKAKAAEDRAYQMLVQQNTEESWKRHAYRLAHPAYADGRIW